MQKNTLHAPLHVNLQVYIRLVPTVQCLIAWSMQKWRERPGPFNHVNDDNVYLGRQRGLR